MTGAIATIFNDVNVPQLFQRAYNLYCDEYNKISRLAEWTGMVITNTIKKDFVEVKVKYHEQYFELKRERYNLIQTKVKEALGSCLSTREREYINSISVYGIHLRSIATECLYLFWISGAWIYTFGPSH